MERGELGTLDKSSDDTDRLLLPTHMKHVTSLASMEAFSDGSQSDVETRSRSSGIALDMGPTGGTPLELSPLGWDHRGGDTDSASSSSSSESSPLCSINLKEYISDLTLYSHTALMRDDEAGSGGKKDHHRHHHHHKPGELDTTSTADNNTFTSTYDKWKQLSGPMILFLVLGLVILVWGRGHLLQLLQWLEMLPLHLSMLVFIVLFTLISFPFGFGYIILNMMAGYLYGIVRGQLIVMVSVSVGMTVSFLLCRRWLKEYARTMVTSNALQAVLRVVEGPNGFKVILLTRFTPFPFGLQNVLFAVSFFLLLSNNL